MFLGSRCDQPKFHRHLRGIRPSYEPHRPFMHQAGGKDQDGIRVVLW
jgi:hypothetical protein